MARNAKSPLMLALGLLVAVTAMVTFSVLNITVLDNTIKPFAGWVFVGGFVGVYLLSDRQLNGLEDYEAVAFVVPLLAAVAIQQIPAMNDALTEYEPYAGLALLMLTVGAFYALGTNMSLEYVSLELLFGGVILVTASVQYDLVQIDVLSSHITDVAPWFYFFALAGAYLVSQRNVGSFTNMELSALLIGIGGYAGYEYLPKVQDMVMNNSPHAGIVLVGITVVAYYFLMNDGSFTPN